MFSYQNRIFYLQSITVETRTKGVPGLLGPDHIENQVKNIFLSVASVSCVAGHREQHYFSDTKL